MNFPALGTLDHPGAGGNRSHSASPEWLAWLRRAISTEVLGFRFENVFYPIELVADAGAPASLHYYVYSDRLFFDVMELDPQGVPCQRSRTLGRFYNPAYIAWYGLMALERSLRGSEHWIEAAQVQVDWLVRNAVRCQDKSVVWTFPVDVREGKCKLKTPWVSAMIQGLAMSLLVRAHRLGGSRELIDLGLSSMEVFRKAVGDGGVRSDYAGWVLYEEYPAYPLPRVLDGFLFSLLGLYDLWIETGDSTARQLFNDGLRGLVHAIELWNYKNKWSWYGSHGYLCPSHYHQLNRLLLIALANVTGESRLSHYAELWNPVRLNTLERIWLYLVFVSLKNWSRLRSFARR